MSEMGFKDSDIGLLPSEWEIVNLGDLFELKQGKSLSAKKQTGKNRNPFLRTSNVFWGRIDLSSVDEMDFSENEVVELRLQPGDLLVCEGGDIGRTAMWEGQLDDCYYQNHLHRLRKKTDNVYPSFVMYWLQAAFTLLNLYSGVGNKTTIPNLSQGRLKSLPVPLPPLPEQRAIAHVLTTVRQSIEATGRVTTAARELKRSLMSYLFTYGPVPIDQADQLPLKETEIGDMPEGWEELRLGDLISNSYSGGTPSTTVPEYWNGDIPWTTSAIINDEDVTLNNYQRRITHEGLHNSASKIAPRGSLIVGTRVGVGKAVVPSFDVAMSQDLTALLPYDYENSCFLAHAFKTNHLQQQIQGMARGTTIKGIPRNDLLSVFIPFPTKYERGRITSILEIVTNKISIEEQRKSFLESLFTSLLHHLMIGKIRAKY